MASHAFCLRTGNRRDRERRRKYLKEKNPKIRVVAGDPVGSIYTDYAKTRQQHDGAPYKVEGIGGDKIPTSLHWDVIDEWVVVSDRDAMQMARRLSREEGLFVGGIDGREYRRGAGRGAPDRRPQGARRHGARGYR